MLKISCSVGVLAVVKISESVLPNKIEFTVVALSHGSFTLKTYLGVETRETSRVENSASRIRLT